MKAIKWIMVIGLFVLVLSACSNKDDTLTAPEEADAESTDEQVEEVAEEEPEEATYAHVYPLTGEPTNEEVDHRAVAVMVNNHSKARPQSGLSQADVVYEVLAEGQITRFLAVFHSQIPEIIGPVRSARPYYVQLAKGLDALYLYHGAAEFINNQISASGIDYLNGSRYDDNGWLFKRSNDRRAPHNSYLVTSGIEQAMEDQGYESTQTIDAFPYAADQEAVGDAAGEVQIIYGERERVLYEYEEGSYLRSSDGAATVDSENGERIAVENVFIVRADHEVVDSAGRRDIDLQSGGSGYLLQKGTVQPVEWKNIDGRILPYQDGKALSFVPGQMWVNVIPEGATVNIQ